MNTTLAQTLHTALLALLVLGGALLVLGGAAKALAAEPLVLTKPDGAGSVTVRSIALMRDGRRSVVSVDCEYQGPASDLVVLFSVPPTVDDRRVRPVPTQAFDRLEAMSAPRLVHYWEQDPCGARAQSDDEAMPGGGASVAPPAPQSTRGASSQSAQQPNESTLAVFSSGQGDALSSWLERIGFQASDAQRARITALLDDGSPRIALRVAKSDLSFDNHGVARLPAFRFWYESDGFALPAGLWAPGDEPQDLLVYVLGRRQRYDVGNRPNATLPTNLSVTAATRENLDRFYRALFERTAETSNDAVVTEYAWNALTCDPCPANPLIAADIHALGADVIDGPGQAVARRPVQSVSFVDAELSGRGQLESGDVAVALGFSDKRAIVACLNQTESPQTKPYEEQELRLGFEIAADGTVRSVRTVPPSSAEVRRCLRDELATLDMPRPDGGAAVVITRWRLDRGATDEASPLPSTTDFVLTRLHARRSAAPGSQDLIFRAAAPISGGLGGSEDLDKQAVIATRNAFQGRFIVHHPWTGRTRCESPRRGVWGPRPPRSARDASPGVPETARRTREAATSDESSWSLASAVTTDVPQIQLETSAPPEDRTARATATPASERLPAGDSSGLQNGAPDAAPVPRESADHDAADLDVLGESSVEEQRPYDRSGDARPQALIDDRAGGMNGEPSPEPAVDGALDAESSAPIDGGTAGAATNAEDGPTPIEHVPLSDQKKVPIGCASAEHTAPSGLGALCFAFLLACRRRLTRDASTRSASRSESHR